MVQSKKASLVFFVLFLALIGAGCSAEEPDAVIDPGTPVGAVEDWLAALGDPDVDILGATTSVRGLAVMVGAENNLSVAQLYAVADDGLPGPTAESYWGSFAESFELFLGGEVSAIDIGEVDNFDIEEASFAAVTVIHGAQSAEVVTQQVDGVWVVDLLATSGVALSGQITELMGRVADEVDDARVDVARAYLDGTTRSMQAALDRDPTNRTLQLEIEALQSLPTPGA